MLWVCSEYAAHITTKSYFMGFHSFPTVINQLRDANILKYFDAVVCGDMVERSKPAPDIFLKACEELGVRPERAYAIEDSYNGIRAAYAGHLRPIMVPDLLPANEEMKEISERILGSLLEIEEYFFGGIIY